MTESEFQAKLLNKLRKHARLKDAVIWKHADRFNGGIPDVSITINAHTTWLELKVAPDKPTPLQQYYLELLRHCGHVVTYYNKDGHVTVGKIQHKDTDAAVEYIVKVCHELI